MCVLGLGLWVQGLRVRVEDSGLVKHLAVGSRAQGGVLGDSRVGTCRVARNPHTVVNE